MVAKHGNLFRSVRTQERAGRRASCVGVRLEALEARALLSGTTYAPSSVTFADGVLTLVGTEGDDRINVEVGRWGDYSMPLSDGSGFVKLADVKAIKVYGLGGDDMLCVWRIDRQHTQAEMAGTPEYAAAAFDVPVSVYGGAGDDVVISEGAGDDVLDGGAGFDWSQAGDGDDRFSAEMTEQYYAPADLDPDAHDSFLFKAVGDRFYKNPFARHDPRGEYRGVHYPQHDEHRGEMEPIAPPVEVVDEVEVVVKPAPEKEEAAPVVAGPVVVMLPPTAAVFAAAAEKVKAADVWEDAKE